MGMWLHTVAMEATREKPNNVRAILQFAEFLRLSPAERIELIKELERQERKANNQEKPEAS